MIGRRLPVFLAILALAALPATASASVVSSSEGPDTPDVTGNPGENSSLVISVAPGGGLAFDDAAGITTTDPPDVPACKAESATRVVCPGAGGTRIDMGDGNDRVENQTSAVTRIRGGTGADILIGGGARDWISGDRGSEDRSGAGNDVIAGGAGDDSVDGEGGNDAVDGGDGDDVIAGLEGNDVVRGGAGNDNVERISQGVSTGPDIEGDVGNDVVDGGPGNDNILSLRGRDRVTGGDGNDEVLVGDQDWQIVNGAARADCGPGRDYFIAYAGDVVAGCELFEVQFFCRKYPCVGDYRVTLLTPVRPTVARRVARVSRPTIFKVPVPPRVKTLAARRTGVQLVAQLRTFGGGGFFTPAFVFAMRSKL